MAPKKKRVPTPPASARTKPPSETAARGKLIDVWKGTTPIECFSCHQKTRSLDRNAPPSKPKYVYWLQAKWKNGKRQPVGRECYSCYKVRRRNFPTLSQEELCEKRKEKVVDDKFWELRADLVGERNELKAEGHVNIQQLILKSKETFGERFVTGTFVPLGEFAEKRRLKYEDEDTLGKLIAAKYPEYEVVTDANGVLGVEILDQTGSEYKFKRGARESTRLMKKKTFASKADAEEDFAMSVAKTEQKADLARARSAHEVGCGSLVESGEMPKRETSPSIEPRSSRHSRAISEAASGPAASVASDVKCSTPRKGMAVAALRRPGPASRKRLLAKQCHVERDDDEGSHADDEDDDHPGCEESERKTSAERTLCSAEDVLAKSLAVFGAGKHLANTKQKRAVEKTVGSIRRWGRKCGAIECDEAQRLSQRCFDEADAMEERQSVFDIAREDFATLVLAPGPPTIARISAIDGLKAENVASLTVAGCARISEAALTDAAAAAAHYAALSAKHGEEACPSFGMAKITSNDVPPGNAMLVTHSQRTALLSHLERIFKLSDFQAMVDAATLYVAPLAKRSASALLCSDTEDALAKMRDEDNDWVFGWAPQLFFDLASVYVMARLGECLVQSKKCPKADHRLVKIVFDNSAKLSARVRCYHKTIHGIGHHPAKRIWGVVVETARAIEEVVTYNVDIESAKRWVEKLSTAHATGEHEKCANALVDVCDGPERDLALRFARYAGAHSGSEPQEYNADAELVTVGNEFCHAVVLCVGTVVKATSLHAEVIDDFIGNGAKEGSLDVDAGGGEIVQKVHDEAHWENPDNLPDCVALLMVTEAACTFLKEFNLSKDSLVLQGLELAGLHISLWKVVNTDITPTFTHVHKLRRLAELFRNQVWNKAGVARARAFHGDDFSRCRNSWTRP